MDKEGRGQVRMKPYEKDLLLAVKWRKGAISPEIRRLLQAGSGPQLTVSENMDLCPAPGRD